MDFGVFTCMKWGCRIGRPIRMMRVVALTLGLAVTSSCSMVVGGHARHNSRGTACVESPIPATIDLVLGLLLVAAAATGEASAGDYVIPGAFVASGAVGAVSAARCSGKHEPAQVMVAPLANTAPSFGNAYVDPTAESATPTDLGIAPIEQASNPPRLRLGPDYDVGPSTKPTVDPRPTAEEPEPAKQSCGDAPGSCPKGQTCAIAGDDAGHCVIEPQGRRRFH